MHYRLTFNFLFSNILYYITTIRQNIKKPDINHEILDKTIILINNQSNLGEISTEEALNIAKNKGLDLVVVGEKSGVRVCKILDFSKDRVLFTLLCSCSYYPRRGRAGQFETGQL